MKRRDMSTLSLVTQLGLTVVTALVLCLLLGLWLDSVLNTRPWLTLAFSMFGVMVGTVGVYRLVTRAIADSVENTPRARPSEKTPGTSGEKGVDREADPWADEDAKEDDWDRDPWKDDDPDAAEKRRARQEETERRLGLRPPSVKPSEPEEEQR